MFGRVAPSPTRAGCGSRTDASYQGKCVTLTLILTRFFILDPTKKTLSTAELPDLRTSGYCICLYGLVIHIASGIINYTDRDTGASPERHILEFGLDHDSIGYDLNTLTKRYQRKDLKNLLRSSVS